MIETTKLRQMFQDKYNKKASLIDIEHGYDCFDKDYVEWLESIILSGRLSDDQDE